MSEQAFQPLLYAISADVVKRLVAGGMSLGAALGAFYSSHLYAALSDSGESAVPLALFCGGPSHCELLVMK